MEIENNATTALFPRVMGENLEVGNKVTIVGQINEVDETYGSFSVSTNPDASNLPLI